MDDGREEVHQKRHFEHVGRIEGLEDPSLIIIKRGDARLVIGIDMYRLPSLRTVVHIHNPSIRLGGPYMRI